MPKSRTPRELLLTALERRRITGFRASTEVAWVVFPPQEEGGTSLAVMHMPRSNKFRVVSSETSQSATSGATTLGEFRSGDAAAACIEDALGPTGQAATTTASVTPVTPPSSNGKH